MNIKDILITFLLFVQLSNITQHIRNGSLKTILTFLQSHVIRTTWTFTSERVTEFAKGTKSLIILDDCASSQDVKKRTGELVKLAFSARHFGLSTIVITQQLTSVAKPCRENISKLATFYNPSSKDMKALLDEYLGDVDKKDDIIKTLENNDYARLEKELRRPYEHKIVIE